MKITGLQPNTRYYYNYGDLVSTIPDLMRLPCSQCTIIMSCATHAFIIPSTGCIVWDLLST